MLTKLATFLYICSAKELIKRRQKFIQLADVSELGWKVVTEYEANPIASDSDDEKRIYKAEARANRKAKADKSKKKQNRFTPYSRNRQPTESPARPGVMRHGFQGQRQRPGLCFACGKPGHWKIDCVQNSSNNKISTKFLKAILTEKSKKNVSKPLEKVVTHLKDENDNKEVINISPVGRLKKYIKNWEEISDNQYNIRYRSKWL